MNDRTKINFPKHIFRRRDKLAVGTIWSLSVIVFIAVFILSRVQLKINLGFDVHLFALFNAFTNASVSLLLIVALIAVRKNLFLLHRNLMLSAISLSVLFLISYICHHLFAGSTAYGGKGMIRYFYFIILVTHIILAGIILPFILFTAYRALTGEYERHRKLAKITFPIWLYVSITGVIIYLMISPYYE